MLRSVAKWLVMFAIVSGAISADAQSQNALTCETRDAAGRCTRCVGFISDRSVRVGQVESAVCRNMPAGARVAVRARGYIVSAAGALSEDVWIDANLVALGGGNSVPTSACAGGSGRSQDACGAVSGTAGTHPMSFEVTGTVPPSGDVQGTLSITQCTSRAASATECHMHQASEGAPQAARWEIQVL